jgi:hypothetical protein
VFGIVWIGDEIVAVPSLHGGVELSVSAFWASAVGVGKRGDVAEFVGDEGLFPVEQRGWDGSLDGVDSGIGGALLGRAEPDDLSRGAVTRNEQEAGNEFREAARHVFLQDSKRLCC